MFFRGRIQGGGDINTALGLLPDKLKTELALHVNLSVLKKVGQFNFGPALLKSGPLCVSLILIGTTKNKN